MGSEAFHIASTKEDRLQVQCFGVLTVAVVEDVTKALKADRDGWKNGGVLVDLTGVIDYEESVREPMLRFHEAVRARASRSAWLSDRARIRGLALWTLHMATDGNGSAVMTLAQADAWLRGNFEREKQARTQTKLLLEQIERTLSSIRSGGAR